ncbi:MAG: glycosyltransferase family 39 protein, partial [Anaerolineae bacterium]|nr:glycosyltransferase family 39 protein [Anaerolineae bacterium]
MLLVIFTILTIYNSVQLPIGEADDETDHYQYHRFVAQTGHPPLTEADRREAGFKGGLAPLYYWLTAWPIALVGADSVPDIRRVDARPERHIPTDGLGINHVLHTLDEVWPWRGQVLAWHLVRLLSLPMAWVTIIATYALAHRLKPDTPTVALGAAALVAFLPRFVISSAVINDDNLVFALTALLLLVQIIILQREQPPTPKLMAIFGALYGLALVTKYFSLILIPEILFTLWFAFHKKNMSHVPHPASRALLAFLIALFLTAGLWFSFIMLRFNRIDELGLIPGLAASLGEPQITEGLVGLLSGQSVRPVAATYSLPEWFGLLYRSFW